MASYKAGLTFNQFKAGEIVDIDPTEWPRAIEKGWLKPWPGEGVVTEPVEDTVEVGGVEWFDEPTLPEPAE